MQDHPTSRYCALIASDADAASRLAQALTRAGWIMPANRELHRISLVIHDAGDDARRAGLPQDVLRIAIGDGASRSATSDANISGDETDARLIELFADWLPPGSEQLDRMATAFGRDAMVPLVEGLRQELRAALTALATGAPCDAHKLSGLTGTIGFLDASNAWRRLDEAGDATDVWRTTRVAVVAIERWLED